MDDKTVVLFSVMILLVFAFFNGGVVGQVNEVSDPGKANKIMGDFSTPIIRPENSGDLSFNLTNVYNGDFENVRFTAEIYGYANLDLEKNISDVENPPVFDTTGRTKTSFSMETLPSNSTFPQQFTIDTDEDTEEGVYFVRFKIQFTYSISGNESTMKSKGYFSDSLWENATKRPGTLDRPYYAGSINITMLGVNGILPDTSFSVKTPIPRWPQYLLGVLSAFFGILAVMLYMQEEYNSFPWLEDILNKWSSKFNQLRRRLKYRLRKR